jgi:hypothetical protein
MTTICSQATEQHNNIQFPKNTVIIKTAHIPIYNRSSINYEVCPVVDRFDPNMSGSPPNTFVSILQKRMNVYYSNETVLYPNNNDNITNVARNRTLSWEHKLK